MRQLAALACLSLAWIGAPLGARASEIGHYNPAFMNIRDLIVPQEPGIYAALYSYYYTTDRLNDAHGDEIDGVVLHPGPGPGVPEDLDVDLDLYALAPIVMWSSPWEVLGARYAAFVAPSVANASVQAALSIGKRAGVEVDNSSFALGDLAVQPIWLGWTTDHLDVSAGYAFYAATGKYDTDVHTVLGNPVRIEDKNNIGYGFWTHQVQLATAIYPFDNKGTAIVTAATYEYHSEKEDFDLQPGEDITLNWGISQYVPLTKDQHVLLEIGPAGYNGWQVSVDRGADVTDRNRDRVFGAGGQIGVTYVPATFAVNFHGFYEYDTRDRFQGVSLGLSVAKGF